MTVTSRTRTVSKGQTAHVIARAGLTARGVIYILIGWVAILVAVGKSSREADQRGALQLLAHQPFGLFLLWLLGIGLAAYALWRLSEAAFGVIGEGTGAGPRLKSLIRAVIYAGFAFTAFQVIGGGRKSQSGQQSDWTAQVMRQSGGRIAVGIIGAIVVIAGLVLVAEGAQRKFLRYLRTRQMSPQTRRNVERLGMVGTVARGLVFTLAGALIIDAAVAYKPSRAGGLGRALSTLHNQPFGKVALIAAALGLMIFGVYGLCEARWRRV